MTERIERIETAEKTTVCGAGVWDIIPQLSGPLREGKQEGELRDELGGGVHNVAIQMQGLGAVVAPTVYVGNDMFGQQMSATIEETFPLGMTWPILEYTRRSLIIGSATITCRPDLTTFEIPPGIAQRIATADRSVVTPDHPRNAALIESLLDLNSNSVLQLSLTQLAHPTTMRLAAKAACVAINSDELAAWTGKPKLDIWEQMKIIRAKGVRDLIVTHTGGVEAMIGADCYSEAAFQVRQVSRTSGAGDRFLGTYLAYVDKEGPAVSLRRGQAAAALFVEGTSGYGSPAVIRRTCQERCRVEPRQRKASRLYRAARLLTSLFT